VDIKQLLQNVARRSYCNAHGLRSTSAILSFISCMIDEITFWINKMFLHPHH